MKVLKEQNIILNSNGRDFLCDAFYPANDQKNPLLIFIHGYKGYKDWGAWSLMAERIAQSGYFVVTFNFSHNGTTVASPTHFSDLEAFGNNTFVKELDDLEVVIQAFSKRTEVDANKIVLMGHSRGGGIAVIKALEKSSIKALITLAGVSDFEARMPKGEQLRMYLADGVMYTENKRTGQRLPHFWTYYDSFIENKDRLSIKNSACSLKIPYLIIAAEEDEAVSLAEAKNLNNWCSSSHLKIIEKTGHTFGAKEPWDNQDLPSALLQVIEETTIFLSRI